MARGRIAPAADWSLLHCTEPAHQRVFNQCPLSTDHGLRVYARVFISFSLFIYLYLCISIFLSFIKSLSVCLSPSLSFSISLCFWLSLIYLFLSISFILSMFSSLSLLLSKNNNLIICAYYLSLLLSISVFSTPSSFLFFF